ncbi:hypothetical protein [Micromonospora rosaria]|uniref:hypothetical protein n=1 Tax=Micromonospora rosaria TaxID=47874 RepID=UPI000AEE04CC|nr:hypothetical protein [Micromonospora rosaria]
MRYFDELAATEPQAFAARRDAATSTLADLQQSPADPRPELPAQVRQHAQATIDVDKCLRVVDREGISRGMKLTNYAT